MQWRKSSKHFYLKTFANSSKQRKQYSAAKKEIENETHFLYLDKFLPQVDKMDFPCNHDGIANPTNE